MSSYNQPVCPKCGSKQILYQVRTDSYLCRRCGASTPKFMMINVEK